MTILKRVVLAGAMAAAVLAASPEEGQKTKSAKAPAKAEKAAPALPAGAEQTSETTWRYKDPQGKVWVYSKTPFGYSRHAEGETAGKEAQRPRATYRVLEVKGGVVTFESASVFGKSRWSKKRDELNADEKASLDAHENGQKQQ